MMSIVSLVLTVMQSGMDPLDCVGRPQFMLATVRIES